MACIDQTIHITIGIPNFLSDVTQSILISKIELNMTGEVVNNYYHHLEVTQGITLLINHWFIDNDNKQSTIK